MFLIISQFSSSVSLIGLGSFFTRFPFPLTIPRSAEFASKEKSNCNSVTLRVESFQSESHIITIIQNLTLVSLLSTMTPHPVGFPLGAAVPSLFTHSTFYVLVSLRTRLPTHLSHRYACIPAKKIFSLDIYLRLSTYRGMQLSSSIIAVRGKEVELLF